MDEKMERLATIMYEEDKERWENGKPLMYSTEEDFKAEMEEREKDNTNVSRKEPQ